MPVRRRVFLGAGAAGLMGAAAGSVLPAVSAEKPSRSSSQRGDTVSDVVVIGAGISGLVAARELEKKGFSTTVLEAMPRLGGRCVRQKTIQDWWVDLGGQWMGKTHRLFQSLAQELGIKTFDSYFDGNTVLIWNGSRFAAPIDGDVPGSFLGFPYDSMAVPSRDRDAALKLHRDFLQLVETIDAERPWLSPNARALDTETIESWMRQRTDSDLAHFILQWYSRVGGSGGFEPGDASILHLAQTQKASPQAESPEAWLLYGAAGQIPAMLAARLKGEVRVSTPVQAVFRQQDGSYQVKASDDSSHHCRAVVVAIPPPLRSRILFEPALPSQVMKFQQRSPMASMFKVMCVYPTAWWRQQGLSGYGQGNLNTVQLTADSSPPSGTPGVLAAFVAADRAISLGLANPRERREAILADLVRYWGAKAGEPTDYIEVNWSEESWTTGGFTSYLTPGSWTSVGQAWREPVGRIAWAGTESSPRWAGYYEGAIQAGIDAAQILQARLS